MKLIKWSSLFLEAKYYCQPAGWSADHGGFAYAFCFLKFFLQNDVHTDIQKVQFMTVFFFFCCVALWILLVFLFLHPFHGHIFLGGVIFNLTLYFAVLQWQVLCLRDTRYLKRTASCLQPAEQRYVHHPDQHRRQQWQHVQEHPGEWCGTAKCCYCWWWFHPGWLKQMVVLSFENTYSLSRLIKPGLKGKMTTVTIQNMWSLVWLERFENSIFVEVSGLEIKTCNFAKSSKWSILIKGRPCCSCPSVSASCFLSSSEFMCEFWHKMPRAKFCPEKLSPGAGFWKQGAVCEEADKPFNYVASLCGKGCQTSSNQRLGVSLDAGFTERFWQCWASGRGSAGSVLDLGQCDLPARHLCRHLTDSAAKQTLQVPQDLRGTNTQEG